MVKGTRQPRKRLPRKRVVMVGSVQVPAGEEWPEPTKAQIEKLKDAFATALVGTLELEPKLVLDRICKPARPRRKLPVRRPGRKP
jgi:hypothetical protein